MDPLTASLLIGGVAAPVIGGLLGQQSQDRATKSNERLQREALAALQGVPLPELNYELPVLPQYEMPADITLRAADYSGVTPYTPGLVSPEQLQDTALTNIALDPQLRAAQLQALSQLQQYGQGGLTAGDQLKLAQVQRETSARERGAREAILQGMRQRGIAGSGLELAAQLSNQQAQAEQANLEGLSVAAEAQQRALQALQQAGNLGGQIRGQDYQEALDKARAMDIISEFNARQRAASSASNVGAQNEAQRINRELAVRQAEGAADIANQQALKNVDIGGLRNAVRSQQYGQAVSRAAVPSQIAQQQFQNQYQKAGGQSAGLQNLGAMTQQAGAQQAQMLGGVGSGIGQGIFSYLGNQAQADVLDKKLKAGQLPTPVSGTN